MAIIFQNYVWETKTYVAETKYIGRVLKTWRNNSYQLMSDVWGSADCALVLDENNEPKSYTYQVYGDCCDPNAPRSTAEVDATEEVRQLYKDWLVKVEYSRLLDQATQQVNTIEKGCIARVTKGRNAQGTIGKVVVVMDALYGMGYRASREKKLGIATSDVVYDKALPNGKVVKAHKDMVWVWARNCRREDVAEINQHQLWLDAEARVAHMLLA